MTETDEGTPALERLQRRLERERRARLEAEAIAEQGLRNIYAANQSLDRRIEERTRDLEEASRRAQAANRAKSVFLSHVGHELRTPINGIAGMLELLDGEVTTETGRSWLASARESSDRLERLVDRILWFIELETADLTAAAEAIGVEDVLDRAAERWRHPCAKVGQLLSVEVATPLGSTVTATRELDRALDELLDNAVTYGSPGAVRLRAVDGDTGVRFEVEDDGPGIDPSVVASAADVLEPGGDPSTRRDTGAGIGLALVKRVAAALGGEFGIERSPSGGSIVWLSVPA